MTTIQNCTSCHLDGRVYYVYKVCVGRGKGCGAGWENVPHTATYIIQ
jgi:hypothetical protein